MVKVALGHVSVLMVACAIMWMVAVTVQLATLVGTAKISAKLANMGLTAIVTASVRIKLPVALLMVVALAQLDLQEECVIKVNFLSQFLFLFLCFYFGIVLCLFMAHVVQGLEFVCFFST